VHLDAPPGSRASLSDSPFFLRHRSGLSRLQFHLFLVEIVHNRIGCLICPNHQFR
jgi:hypothetical protein